MKVIIGRLDKGHGGPDKGPLNDSHFDGLFQFSSKVDLFASGHLFKL
jgi:hypothetical protein